MKNMMENRKGDVPIAILIVGILGICALALLSFFFSSFKLGEAFTELHGMETLNVKINEYGFYKDKGVPEATIERVLNVSGGDEKYLDVREEDLYVRYYIPKS